MQYTPPGVYLVFLVLCECSCKRFLLLNCSCDSTAMSSRVGLHDIVASPIHIDVKKRFFAFFLILVTFFTFLTVFF